MTALGKIPVGNYLACARLNLRVAGLAAAGLWLGSRDWAAGYDAVAPDYDETWSRLLQPVTRELVERLPVAEYSRIVDLGCGTGYATSLLAQRYQRANILGVDLSEKMLECARNKSPDPRIEWSRGDMLSSIQSLPSSETDLVFSAWAIGYSHPTRVIAAAARTLRPGGTLAFVVNLADTLAPVFLAFRRCMARFPERVQRAAWLRFPKSLAALARCMESNGFVVGHKEEGYCEVAPPASHRGSTLDWLSKTGVLAGFDALLPLEGRVSETFETLLRENPEPIRHHYAALVARLP